MKGQAYINNKDIWSTWGAMLAKGTYEKLLKPASMKDYISNSSRLEHGIRVVATAQNSKTNERELALQFILQGDDEADYLQKCSSFISELESGLITFKVPKLNATYKLVYTDCSTYGNYGNKMGKFTVKFIEPNVKDRA